MSIQVRAEKLFERLRQWPNVSGAKPLSGKLAGHWRMRTGDYRVQFRVDSDPTGAGASRAVRVVIERVGHRDRFYEE